MLLMWLQAPWTERLQATYFDTLNWLSPRTVHSSPATVVAIDERSLRALGQWPWPRTMLAQLVDAVERAGPAAIGINVLMPEPDALSPERLLQPLLLEPSVAAKVRTLRSNDAVLGRSLAASHAVLAMTGMAEVTGRPLRTAPIVVSSKSPVSAETLQVTAYRGALTSVEELSSQAAGSGLVSAEPARGILRRIPLVATIGGTLVPALTVEMVRVAAGAKSIRLDVAGTTAVDLSVAGLVAPTDADGTVRIHFSRHRDDVFVSAVDVLEGRVEPALLSRKMVLLGVTAVGLSEVYETPVGQRMSGSEIQAQLLENFLEGAFLRRPHWARVAETLMLVVLGAVLIVVAPRWNPANGVAVLLACVALPILGSFAAYRTLGILLDAATPGLYLLVLFGALMVSTLTESMRHRRALRLELQQQREASARIEGELQAAERIQRSSLPRSDLLDGDRRIDLYATLTPARVVGGDLYDFFMLDADRLFLMVGDVAGKGLAASIFMAVGKALYKSSLLRAPHAELGDVMREANTEVSRDNAESLFITAFAAILDLRTGLLNYCNAGHDNPWRMPPGASRPQRIDDGDGPPLCALEDFDYRSAQCRLEPGEWLWLVTDGVTEAQGPAGAVYGADRAERVLAAASRGGADSRAVVHALQEDVQRFVDNAEPSDDLTIVALRWQGPASAMPA